MVLSEGLAGLSIFTDNVIAEEKKLIISALSKESNTVDLRRVNPETTRIFQEKTVSDFVTPRLINLCLTFKFSQHFLCSDPKTGKTLKNIFGPVTLAAIRVVNDYAEWTVKLAIDTLTQALTQMTQDVSSSFKLSIITESRLSHHL